MKKNLSVYRHLAKTVSWRIIGTIDTIVLGWLVTGNFKIGLSIGGFELITKMLLYFLTLLTLTNHSLRKKHYHLIESEWVG